MVMKRVFSTELLLKPSVPFTEYQHVSTYYKFLCKLKPEKFRPFVIHTRDYCFSKYLHKSFGDTQKIYTVFNIFYLHCGLVYKNIPIFQQRKLDDDIRIFNRHWGMFMYSSTIDWKIFDELQRSWLSIKIGAYEGNYVSPVYDAETCSDPEKLVEHIKRVSLKLADIKDPLLIDWVSLY